MKKTSIIVLVALASPSLALAAPLTATADGIRVVLERDSAGVVRGQLTYGGEQFRLVGRVVQTDGTFSVKGTIDDDGEALPFTATWRGERMRFAADGERAELQIFDHGDFANRTKVEPKPKRTSHPKSAGRLPKKLKLKQVEYRDVHMNGMVAYTQLVPASWKVDGRIEWSAGAAPFPQRRISITAPNGVELHYLPAMQFEYVEYDPQFLAQAQQFGQQVPPLPSPNQPPPQDLGAWLAQNLAQTIPTAKQVRVVRSSRDRNLEAALRQVAGQDLGMTHHRIEIGFVKDGRAFTSLIVVGYQQLPIPMPGVGRSIRWTLYVDYVVTVPDELRAAYEPLIATVVSSQRSTPNWFAAKNQILAQLSQQRHENAMALIRARGRAQASASDAQMARWRRDQAANDAMHKKVINGINDTNDYALPGGGSVNLPNTYGNVYRTTRGDFVLSDHTLDDVDLTRLQPSR